MSHTGDGVTQELLDKILIIAESYPKGEGVTIEDLMSEHGFSDSNMVNAALDELERQGKLTARPLFYADTEENK